MGDAAPLLTETEIEDWSLPIWREAFLGVDWVKLRCSPVYYGRGVKRGEGKAVVVVPGFLGHDMYLVELYTWLWRMGYKPYFSRIGRNADCPNILVDHLLNTVDRAYNATGKPVNLIGHSLGGVLSLGAASQEPDRIGHVVTLGSPFRGPKVHPWVLRHASLVRNRIRRNKHRRPAHKPYEADCFTYACACGFVCRTKDEAPQADNHLAIYTKSDGIVDWKMCRTPHGWKNKEVKGTHCGLAWNPEVFRLIADRLAKPLKKAEKKRAKRKTVASRIVDFPKRGRRSA